MSRPTKEHKLIQRSFCVDPRVLEHFGIKKIKAIINNELKKLENEDSYKKKYGN